MIALAAAALFACVNPQVHDGDNLRCDGIARSLRLQSIDAPELPGACRPGRDCTPGDPVAARAHLSHLVSGKAVQCREVDSDRYGRMIAQCTAGGVDLSCAMVRDGFAVERYGKLRCP